MHGEPLSAFDWATGAGLVVAVLVAWLAYFRWKDHRVEPWGALAVALGLGAVAAGIALLAYRFAGALGLPTSPGTTAASSWRFCLGVVGPVEEGAKFLVTWLVVARLEPFDEESDGLVYAATVALGFSCVENLLYLPHVAPGMRVARALSTPLAHAVFSAPWGFGLGWARFSARSRAARAAALALPLLAASVAHGVYDHVLLAHGATWLAGAVVLALWGALVLRADAVVARLSRRTVPASARGR
ncbi:MAG: PrsW family intramembrane metalloprotease [Planctomycetes bacterium]|nr:PrsW family intramembrane metalloprotease [Planctomycetota bacterium]